ncbi:major facilitator superfamily domain-containing protein [Thermothelomyces heterothallicus CBS 202.75]|uniref:major facilitator superfamily domain-containing protein n=1 Tax=Thermothelomyces heterothallicus CBS 202.75 TaxID=1149848 RepID=UPI00374271CC
MGRVDGSTSALSVHLERGLLPEEVEWKPGKKEYAVMITLAIISLMVALDATILVSVLPALAVDLGGSASDAFWAGTSYLLSCAVCQPFIAALSDIFGRKEMLFASICFFTLGTILCAPVARNFTVFFVGRSIQGIVGGGIITMGQVIFADIVPLRQRPKYFSLVLAAWALGSVLGPLIGGLFVEHAIWAGCFYINFPFCGIGLVLVPIYVKLTTAKTSLGSKLGRVDWIGGFFFIGGLTSFLVGISWGGIQYEWKSVQSVTPIVAGVAGVVIAVIWEIYGAQEPFLRPSLFRSPSALATYACALFQGFILFCALYYIPFYFAAVKFEAPTQSGLDIFPVSCLLLPGSIVISLITTRTGRYRWAIWSGWVVTAIGCGLLVLLDDDTKTPVWAVILAIFGIGHGMLLTSVNVGIQAVSRVDGRAAAMYAFMRTLGMSIGVAVGGTVFQNVMINKLKELGLPASIAHDSEAFVQTLARMGPQDPKRIASIQAYLAGFHGVYWTITGAAIASFFISLVIKRHSMDKLLESRFAFKGEERPRAATPGNMTAAYLPPDTGRSSPDMTSVGGRLPSIMKSSPFASRTPSDPELGSGSSALRHSEYSHVLSRGSGTGSSEEELHRALGEGTGTMEQEEEEEEEAIVAYYVQPGGKIVPVEILPDDRPTSEAASIREVAANGPEPGCAGAAVVGSNDNIDNGQGGRQESWTQQGWETSPLITSRYYDRYYGHNM